MPHTPKPVCGAFTQACTLAQAVLGKHWGQGTLLVRAATEHATGRQQEWTRATATDMQEIPSPLSPALLQGHAWIAGGNTRVWVATVAARYNETQLVQQHALC